MPVPLQFVVVPLNRGLVVGTKSETNANRRTTHGYGCPHRARERFIAILGHSLDPCQGSTLQSSQTVKQMSNRRQWAWMKDDKSSAGSDIVRMSIAG